MDVCTSGIYLLVELLYFRLGCWFYLLHLMISDNNEIILAAVQYNVHRIIAQFFHLTPIL